VIEYGHKGPVEAAEWLCDRLGVNMEHLGFRRTKPKPSLQPIPSGAEPDPGEGDWTTPPEQPWPILDTAAFHGLPGRIVDAVEPLTEADPIAVLAQLLASAGCALGHHAHYRVGQTRHYANIYMVICGNTAKDRKGTSYDEIEGLLRGADPQWVEDNVKSGLSSGEGIIWAVHDDVWVQERVSQGGKGKAPTYERVLKEPSIADKRALIIEPEFASALSMTQRQGNSLSPVLRLAWDGRKLQSLTKHSPMTATGAHVGIVGHITIDEFQARLDQISMANGFANRFLIVLVKRSKELPFPGRLDAAIAEKLTESLRSILHNTVIRKEVMFHPETRELWRAEYHDLSAERPGLFGFMVARAEAQVVRLAMIYALLDQTHYIEPAHLRAALAFWRYCESSAKYIFGDALGDSLADEICQALRRAGPDGMTRTDISQLFWGNQSSGKIGAALLLLLKHNKARRRQKPSNGAGRPAEVWIA
jgi:hypothetical protein